VPLSHAICYLLNTFCKVRGEKVIKGFYNNEPRYLLPILNELETGRNYATTDKNEQVHPAVVPWVERYILLSWLSHLMLAPFPLESMSVLQPSDETATLLRIQLPVQVPGVTLRVLAACFERLPSASRERGAAANLLVKLCGRPDMQKLGLLDTLVKWSASFFSKATEGEADIHQCLGVLSFLSGLVASTTNEEIGHRLSIVYGICRDVIGQESLANIKSSAVARKSIVKILRNTVVHCLQPDAAVLGIDATTVLEEVIEYLLEAVADGDTPVRYGSSKALSIITLKLDPELAEQVVEAILGSLNESVYWQGSKRNLSGVNPLRWHGLTLTLAQLLYRKAILAAQLPDVLNALLLSLSFEQRSPTGGSIGTNVRDAACFGVWALSRRYATADLLKVETASIRACEHNSSLSVPQALAIELVVIACLDPAGNIRRGSSAALQELIGRHPNTIEQGIPLVQVVDFHAVGLRQRAMCNVAIKAAALHPLYWQALCNSLLGWRGTGSLDTDSRLFSAKATGLLSANRQGDVVRNVSEQICKQLESTRPREVEERQGLISALAALVETATATRPPQGRSNTGAKAHSPYAALFRLWNLLGKELKMEDKAFTSPALRPELTASSISRLIAALSAFTIKVPKQHWPDELPIAEISRMLDLSLTRHEDAVLDAVASAVPPALLLLEHGHGRLKDAILSDWILKLESEASYNGLRCSGHTVALGAAYAVANGPKTHDNANASNVQKRITQVLTFRCTSAVAIEARVVALRSLGILLHNTASLESEVQVQITGALHIALNDYTITERGDVGSLVRIEALEAVGIGWTKRSLTVDGSRDVSQQIYADVTRLSLEKLDKIRSIAARVLRLRQLTLLGLGGSAADVSSASYFAEALNHFRRAQSTSIREAICLGYINSTGLGSESVAQNARDALIDFIDALPSDTKQEAGQLSLADLLICMLGLIKANIDDDRVLIPLLETMAFLFDMQVMQRLTPASFK